MDNLKKVLLDHVKKEDTLQTTEEETEEPYQATG
jgi:hypothetical protein